MVELDDIVLGASRSRSSGVDLSTVVKAEGRARAEAAGTQPVQG